MTSGEWVLEIDPAGTISLHNHSIDLLTNETLCISMELGVVSDEYEAPSELVAGINYLRSQGQTEGLPN